MQKSVAFRAFLFSAVALLGVITANAQSVTFYANISDTQSDSGWIGHVWVGLEDGAGAKQVIGYYPSGLVDDSKRRANIEYTFSVASIAPARTVLEQYSQMVYLLGIRDCRAFARDIAASLGLRTPPSLGAKSPAEYMAELIDLN